MCLFYRLPSPSVKKPADNVLRILETKTLLPVAAFRYPGFNNVPYFFAVPKTAAGTYHLALAPARVTVDIHMAVQAACPATLQVLRFVASRRRITRVAQAELPGFAVGSAVLSGCDTRAAARLAVNTIAAVGKNEVNPFTAKTGSCTGNDAAEVRVYDFDGRRLRLVAMQHTYSRGGGISFAPDGRTLAFALRNFNTKRPAGCAGEYSSTLEIAKVQGERLEPALVRGALPEISLHVHWSLFSVVPPGHHAADSAVSGQA